jgi:hypothetical protein
MRVSLCAESVVTGRWGDGEQAMTTSALTSKYAQADRVG